MEKEEYENNLKLAYSLPGPFWQGYRRGLKRFYGGEFFGSREEHEQWMEKANEKENKHIRSRGLGYRAGYAGKNAKKLSAARIGMNNE